MSTQSPEKQAMSHEQEINERIKRETVEKNAKPPIAVGTIVLVQVPGSRETGGSPMQVPAIVLRQDENRDLSLSAFHLGGMFQMRGVHPGVVEVVEATVPLEP